MANAIYQILLEHACLNIRDLNSHEVRYPVNRLRYTQILTSDTRYGGNFTKDSQPYLNINECTQEIRTEGLLL